MLVYRFKTTFGHAPNVVPWYYYAYADGLRVWMMEVDQTVNVYGPVNRHSGIGGDGGFPGTILGRPLVLGSLYPGGGRPWYLVGLGEICDD